MLIGAMNHPTEPVVSEIEWMAEMGLGFVDLTLEAPASAPERVDVDEVREALDRAGLSAVGHTAYYLPIGCAVEGIRAAAVAELARCLEVFARLGVSQMNFHPDGHVPMHGRDFVIRQNLRSIRELLPLSRKLGVGLMVENTPGQFNSVAQLAPLLDAVPELGLHLDIGHCNLLTDRNTAEELIRTYGDRIRHVHLHDNKGGSADLHLPLGAGNVNVAANIAALKGSGYDGTITLEVFSPDRRLLAFSRDVLRQAWDDAPIPAGSAQMRRPEPVGQVPAMA
jgi:sugar phosphate isomerase/epimerase